MVVLAEKKDCCGCAACYNACPKSCIDMSPDRTGFLYPSIMSHQCTECGLCMKACPSLNPLKINTTVINAYVVQHKDDEIRSQSTSGGVFTAIAQLAIEEGGVVFGAAFDDNFHVYHTYVESIAELEKFRSSKYVQSVIGDAFIKAKDFLNNGRMVCFSGTPCQICGLKVFLGKEYDNLITVDFMCRAVPSPLIYDKYLRLQSQKLGAIRSLRFRDKCNGYSYSTLSICAIKNNKKYEYNKGVESDVWLRSFFSRICDRPSCEDCQFQGEVHQSDFTVWDCFNVWKYEPKFDDDLGSSRVIVQSEKAYKFFEDINKNLRFVEVLPGEISDKKKKKSINNPLDSNKNIFYEDAHEMEAVNFFDKYFPYTLKIRALHYVRLVSYKLKIYRFLKKYVWDILRRL